jgi:hypothetical protein
VTGAGVAFSVVFGVAPGYYHENHVEEQPLELVASAWSRACEGEFQRSGINVGGFVSSGLIVYPLQFGCPEGGEIAVSVQGCSNPKFVDESKLDAYADAVTRVADAVRGELKQTTALVSFTDTQSVRYLVQLDPEEALA